METEDLLDALVADLQPVRRAPRPMMQLAIWIALSVPALAIVTAIMGPRPELSALFRQPSFLAAEGFSLATGVISAYVAFCAGRPDQPGWKLLLPPVLLVAWLMELGRQCLALSVQHVSGVFALHMDPLCLPAIALAGIVPALAMVTQLRPTTAFRPMHACFCGALAAAALAETALRLFHAEPSFASLLVWQMGSVALFTLAAGAIGQVVVTRHRRSLTFA